MKSSQRANLSNLTEKIVQYGKENLDDIHRRAGSEGNQ